MRVEATRQPQEMAHVFVLPKGLKPGEALHHFEQHVKPSGFRFEKWKYNIHSGQFITWGVR
jgi:hypothetical protein